MKKQLAYQAPSIRAGLMNQAPTINQDPAQDKPNPAP